MTAEMLWRRFADETGLVPETPYEAWAFGDAADELAALVLAGKKTATASVRELYALDGEELPRAGEYSVLLNSAGEAVCVLRTTRVYVSRFDEVTAQHAAREGEGDGSLACWRAVHERFFSQELAAYGLAFSPEIGVVCEEFEVLFRADKMVRGLSPS